MRPATAIIPSKLIKSPVYNNQKTNLKALQSIVSQNSLEKKKKKNAL